MSNINQTRIIFPSIRLLIIIFFRFNHDIKCFCAIGWNTFVDFILMCMCLSYSAFPEQISMKQQYRVLGNSLNVVVVAGLLHLLVS